MGEDVRATESCMPCAYLGMLPQHLSVSDSPNSAGGAAPSSLAEVQVTMQLKRRRTDSPPRTAKPDPLFSQTVRCFVAMSAARARGADVVAFGPAKVALLILLSCHTSRPKSSSKR